MSKQNNKKVARQYRLHVDQILEIERYSLENSIPKSEVVALAIKKFLGNEVVASLLFVICMGFLLTGNAFAISDQDFSTSTNIIAMFGGIIKTISGIAAPVLAGGGILVGGIMYKKDPEDAMDWIKGGIIGGVLAFGAWGLAKLFLGFAGM